MPEWLLPLCKDSKFAIFSLSIIPTGDIGGNNYYINAESGWHDVVFAVRNILADKYFDGIITPMAVVGESSGGSMAECLTAARPEEFWCAAWSGGSHYQPLQQNTETAMLAVNAWGCPGNTRTEVLQLEASKMGLQIIRANVPPAGTPGNLYHHGVAPSVYELLRAFVDDVRVLRNCNSEMAVNSRHWPIYDEINKVRLPGETFAECWNKLPHELSSALKTGKAGPIFCPGPDSPKGSVILCFDTDMDITLYVQDTVTFLVANGWRTAVLFPSYLFSDMNTAALSSWLKNGKDSSLPVKIIANGTAADFALELKQSVLNTAPVFIYKPVINVMEANAQPNWPHGTAVCDANIMNTKGENGVSWQRFTGKPETDWFNFLDTSLKTEAVFPEVVP